MALYNPYKSTPKSLQRYLYVKDDSILMPLPTGVRVGIYGYIAELSDENGEVYLTQCFRTAEEAGAWWQIETAIEILDELKRLEMGEGDDDDDLGNYLFDLACSYILCSECDLIYGWNDDGLF